MLLNRHNLNIAKLASKVRSRFTLDAIRITPNETVVTDGHCLMTVSTVQLPASTFPDTANGLTPVDDWKPFNLSAKNALKALGNLPKRSTLPVLECAAITINGDTNNPQVITNDLENTASYHCEESASFPDWERVMPKREDMPFVIGLDARLLRALLDQFISLSESSAKTKVPVTFRFKNGNSAVLMESHNSEQKMVGVLMPFRIEETTSTPWNSAPIVVDEELPE
jgi:hypothetical protein